MTVFSSSPPGMQAARREGETDGVAKVVVLGTGGTIAGTAASAVDNVGYTAAQLGVAQLLAAVPALRDVPLEAEQLAQIDSRDLDPVLWRRLAERCGALLARDDVAGVVVTHGTDTLEETAWLLQRVLAPAKPLVLTAAMRPATALLADGPQNLLDAVTVARSAARNRPAGGDGDGGVGVGVGVGVGAPPSGVLVVVAGSVHGAADVQKLHPYRLDAFDSGDAGRLAVIEEGVLRRLRAWPGGAAPLGIGVLPGEAAPWPRVEIVLSHAGASGAPVRALCAGHAVDGLVVAATGNGTVHHALLAALREAQAAGVQVLMTSRCAQGGIVGTPDVGLPWVVGLSPAKARVELMLRLLSATAR